MAQSAKLSARIEAHLARIAAARGVTVDDLTRPMTQDERDAEKRRGAEEWRRDKVRILLSRIPPTYRDAEPRTEAVRGWLAGWGNGVRHRGLVLLGQPGSGKTWEAYAVTRSLLLDHGVPVSVVTGPELTALLRPNADGMADVGRFQAAPVVVLDDLGAEQLTEWGAERFWQIADFRRNHRLPWVITSNLSREQIRARYDHRLVDRLIAEAVAVDVAAASEADRDLPF